MLWNNIPERLRPQILKAVGAPEGSRDSFYPKTLPNLKRCTEADFWNYHSSYSFDSGSIYLGHMELDGNSGIARLFFVATGRFANGGFVVLTEHDYGKTKVHYFTWQACVHVFAHKNIGNCLHLYTCTKCGSAHEVDSSG